MADAGITQADLARRTGYDSGRVAKYMRGRKTPRFDTMLIIDEALEELIRERADDANE